MRTSRANSRRSAIVALAACAAVGATTIPALGSEPERAPRAASATCKGKAATAVGTSERDVLRGSPGRDVFSAGAGDDEIVGTAGDDLICAGSGDDRVVARGGDDHVLLGKGDDVIVGSAGNDNLSGGAGEDFIVGDSADFDNPSAPAEGHGNDKVNGGDGDDILVGDAYSLTSAIGRGNDDMSGGPGNDEVIGDALIGTYANPVSDPNARAVGSGDDELNGLLGTDLIVGDAAVHGPGTAECGGGSDKLNGEPNDKGGPDVSGLGSGKELIVGDCYSSGGDALGAGDDKPIINGGDGVDVLVGDNYAAGRATGSGTDRNMLGGAGNDKLYGDHHPNADDRSGGGKDKPRGGKDNDKLEGGPAKDRCSGGPGKDKFLTKGSQRCEVTTGDP